jgi:hypothetical protein
MKRNAISIMVLALAGVLPLTSWSTPTEAASAPPKTGTVVGTFRLIGGPPPGESIPVRGTVIFIPLKQKRGSSLRVADPGSAVKVAVNATGRFIAHISTGTYTVTASSPQFDHNRPGACGTGVPITVTVKVGKSTSVAVRCDAP